MLEEVQSASLELAPDKSQTEHPASEGVLFVIGDRSSCGSLLLCQGLVANCQAELYVGSNLSCVGGGVEKSELDRAFGKGGMEVQAVIAGVVVMAVSAIRVFCVPDVRKLRHCLGLPAVDGFKQFLVGLFAVTKASWVYLKCFVKNVLLACDDVDDIAEGLRCESLCPDMNVYSAGGVHNRALVPKLPDQFLQIRNVIVSQDGADHLGLVFISCGGY